MTTALAEKSKAIRIVRPTASAPILVASGKTDLSIRAGTIIEKDGRSYAFPEGASVPLQDIKAGRDYVVTLDTAGSPVVAEARDNPIDGGGIAGFHFAPGGHAEARSGGDAEPAINPFSLWDLDFRPSCPDPRGMALVERDFSTFWVDIYLLGTNHKIEGTSRYGAKIADGNSLDRLDFAAAKSICAEHGKRLLTYDEFRHAAFGVTEKSASPRDPDKTGIDPARTSAFGLMQATGNMWIWGTDGDEPARPSIFGGSWVNGSDAGSRYAHVGYHWPENSGVHIGARAACDHLSPA